MSYSYFYIPQYDPDDKEIELDEDTSYHIVQVLRMKTGERLNLTDGKGHLLTADITDCRHRHCTVAVKEIARHESFHRKISIAISLLKNTGRFEWFLEKATEIGVNEIIPLLCDRTEKEKFRSDRMQGICISAMLQSQQTWLPELHEPVQFDELLQREGIKDISQKFIAHCIPGTQQNISTLIDRSAASQLILIGPEGDFSQKEIDMGNELSFIPVSLGKTRLRTETAGVVAASIMRIE